MKTVILLALVGLAAAGSFVLPKHPNIIADKEFLYRQTKVYDLISYITQIDYDSEYYKIAQEYKIEANLDKYTNKKAVQEFCEMWKYGMMNKYEIFSVFYERQREEAIALFYLFYYAKDFETFYKTACWARVYVNEGMFAYSFSIAVLHRPDTQGIILPAPYEIYPYYFVNSEVIDKMQKLKMVNGEVTEKAHLQDYGIYYDNKVFTVYANYSGWYTRYNEEQKLSYFTEDVGLNSFYLYFHAYYPFWLGGEEYGLYKDRRGELYFYVHQQLLARYYMERLTNGLGEIPTFSWREPIKTGYYPSLTYGNSYPFPQRNDYYYIQNECNYEDLEFLDDFETSFRQYLEQGYYYDVKGKKVDFNSETAIDAIGNFWQNNPDFYGGKYSKYYVRYYEVIARHVLGASKDPIHPYRVGPSALELFSTSLRDPVFYQLYKRILYYFFEYKNTLEPYARHDLYFPEVRITDVKVDKLITRFSYYEYDAYSAILWNKEELKSWPNTFRYKIAQPRLDHRPFNINIEVSSEKEVEAVVRIFMAPKYDQYGKEYTLDENRYNFVQLDCFLYKLSSGKNSIVRSSEDFMHVIRDHANVYEMYEKLKAGKVELSLSEAQYGFPQRLLLPRGTKSGFPFQFFVFVYPYVAPAKTYGEGYANAYSSGVGTGARYLDAKPLGFPLDRPIDEKLFHLPNVFFEDVYVYHEGDDYVYNYYIPGYDNVVYKH